MSDFEDKPPIRSSLDGSGGPKLSVVVVVYNIPREVPLPEVATPEEAAKQSRDYLAMGLDGIKLFTGAFMGDKPVVNMEPAVARAAVDVAHAQGKPVFAHPQNTTDVDTVIEAGVDVLAHTAPGPSGYTPEQLARFKSQGIALIPTLSLFTTVVLDPGVTARIVAAAVGQLKQFSDNGGVVLFGTDIGFIDLEGALEKGFCFVGAATRFGHKLRVA